MCTKPAVIHNPASSVPPHAIMFGDIGDTPAAVTADTPLPVETRSAQAIARSTPLAGTTSATTQAGPFAPDLGRPIMIALSGSWSGTVDLLRSTDGGATRLPVTAGGGAWGHYEANANEPVWVETEAAARFYLAIALVSGTLSYRVAQ